MMDTIVKALLFGINLRFREAADGSLVQDLERQTRLSAALERLTIEVGGLSPDTLGRMLDSGEQVVEWLHEHPKAHVTVGAWSVEIESSEFTDVDHERFECPFDHSCVVEEFDKTCDETVHDRVWFCHWAFG
jgi:hypothetical protein